MKFRSLAFLFFFVFAIFLVAVFPLAVDAQDGFVPCGEEGNPCTLCHIPMMVHNIVQWVLITLVPILAVLLVAWAGFLFLISAGDPARISAGKRMIQIVVTGVLIAYLSWVGINFALQFFGVTTWEGGGDWWEFHCPVEEPFAQPPDDLEFGPVVIGTPGVPVGPVPPRPDGHSPITGVGAMSCPDDPSTFPVPDDIPWVDRPSSEVAAAVQCAVDHFNLPRWFYYSIIQRESSFNPQAENHWDGQSGGQWFGKGLTQLTGAHHQGWTYPFNLSECDNSHSQWRWDMGLNQFGDWIDMCNVSPIDPPDTSTRTGGPYDPFQNLERFSTVHAVPWFLYLKSQNPGESDVLLLEMVAMNWKAGIFTSYNPNHSYLPLYRDYVNRFRGPVEAVDGVWDGQPRLP